MDSKHVELTREQLYGEVWKEPAMKVAARYGISGNALAKICRKLSVPVPPRGYWAMYAVGQGEERPPLPAARQGAPLAYQLVKRPPTVLGRAGTQPVVHLAIAVADELSDPHPLIEAAAAHLRPRVRPAKSGVLGPAAGVACLDIAVSNDALDRALRIMDALLKAAEERGHAIEVSTPLAPDAWSRRMDEKRSKTHIVIGDKKIRVRLEEAYEGVLDRESRPSGRLALTTDTYGGDGERKTWRDTQSRSLENYLGEFLETAERIAAFCYARTLEWKRREDETARRRHLESLLHDIHQRADRWNAASKCVVH